MVKFIDKLFGKKVATAEGAEGASDRPVEVNPESKQVSSLPIDDEVDSGGWKAIDAALLPIYEDQEPSHFGTIISYRLGGPDPLQGISAYKREDPVRHWHYITYGFSELYGKESTVPSVSGWGFELTFRLRVDEFGDGPPMWVLNFLQNLARYVFNSGNTFSAGDYMCANGPIAADENTDIRSIAFIEDPELPSIDTPNGRLQFLQIVGLTEDEELALKQWNTVRALEVLGVHLPIYTTDLRRGSLLLREDVKRRMLEGAGKDGSSTTYLFVDQLTFERDFDASGAPRAKVILGARQVSQLLAIMPYRLRFGNKFGFVGNDARVWFKPGEYCDLVEEGNELTVTVTEEILNAICDSLKPQQGIYPLAEWSGLTFEIRPTHIRDQSGDITETVG